MVDEQNEIGENGRSLREIKRMRREYPSGWLELSMYEARALLVDAILDTGPEHEFNHSDLSQRAGITDESVRNHIDVFVDLGLIEPVSMGGTRTYRVNERSRVLFELDNLNSAVNSIRAGKPPSLSWEEMQKRTAHYSRPHNLLSVTFQNFEDRWEAETEHEGEAPDIDDINNWPSPVDRNPPSFAGG